MRDRLGRVALAVLAVPQLGVALWAAFTPRSFYDNFPGGGSNWVAADGPYNEHLIRDFGQLTLGLVVVTAVAVVLDSRVAIMAAALGWIAFAVPHLVYHARHLDVFDTGDQVASITALTTVIVVPLFALGAEATRSGPAPDRAASR